MCIKKKAIFIFLAIFIFSSFSNSFAAMMIKGENIALQAMVTASQKGGDGTSDPIYINDGNVTPDGTGATKWFLYSNCMNAWAQFDFGKSVCIKEALVISGNTKSNEKDIVQAFQFQYNKNGRWIEVPGSQVKENTKFETRVIFSEPIRSDKFRFEVLTDQKLRIREIELYEAVESEESVYTEFEAKTVSSVTNTQWEEAVNTLLNLNILPEEYMLDFQPNSVLSGTEYLKMVLNMFGHLSFDGTEEMENTDGKLNNTYEEAVQLAVNLGWLDTENAKKLSPNKEITYFEAVKIMLRALGYREIAESSDSKNGYMKYAGQLELSDGVTKRQDGYINYGDAAAIMYNALEVPLLEKRASGSGYTYKEEKTFLEVYKKIKFNYGIVESTFFSYMNDEIGKKHVKIGGKEYLSGTSNINTFFGMNVKFYYMADEENRVVYAREYQNKILNIAFDNITDNSSLSYLKYNDEKTGRSRRVQISDSAFYFVNGAKPKHNPIGIQLDSGAYRLIDNNNDGTYDVVLISDYKIVVVKKVDLNEFIIYDINGKNITLANKKAYVIFKNNRQISLEDITDKSVLTVEESSDGDIARIFVSEEKLKGEITGESYEDGKLYLHINGKRYETDASAKGSAFGDVKSCLSISAIFYLDHGGKIVYIDGVSDTKLQYGLILGVDATSQFGSYKVKIYGEDGQTNIYKLADRVNINGVRQSGGSVINGITPREETGVKTVKYLLNSEKEINQIFTAGETLATESEEQQNFGKKLIRYNDAVNYYSQNGVLVDPEKKRDIILSDDTVIFRLPSDLVKQKDSKNYFEVGKGSSVIETYSYLDGRIEVYNMHTDGSPEALVFFWDREPVTLQAATTTSVVSTIFDMLNQDGEIVVGAEVYTNGQRQEIVFSEDCSYNTSFNSFLTNSISGYDSIKPSEFHPGDCIQYVKNKKGEVCMYRVLFCTSDIDKDTPVQYIGGGGEAATFYPPIETYVGYLYDYSSNSHVIKSGGMIKRFPASAPNVYLYYTDKNIVYNGTMDDIITVANNPANPSRVFVRINSKRITDIVVFK